jgi:hypothetical protein
MSFRATGEQAARSWKSMSKIASAAKTVSEAARSWKEYR